jgi:hypothetical protein
VLVPARTITLAVTARTFYNVMVKTTTLEMFVVQEVPVGKMAPEIQNVPVNQDSLVPIVSKF